jgi:hypothetical protein
MKDFVISVAPDGTISAIYDDALAELFDQGQVSITRASHVEPVTVGELPWSVRVNLPSGIDLNNLSASAGWCADMRPSGGPILGPFALRDQALAAEREWLEAKLFGVTP